MTLVPLIIGIKSLALTNFYGHSLYLQVVVNPWVMAYIGRPISEKKSTRISHHIKKVTKDKIQNLHQLLEEEQFLQKRTDRYKIVNNLILYHQTNKEGNPKTMTKLYLAHIWHTNNNNKMLVTQVVL